MNRKEILLVHFNNRLVLDKAEVAEYLGYSVHTMQKILEKRDTKLNDIFFKCGKSWKTDLFDLADFLEAGHHKKLDSSPLTTSGRVRVRALTLPIKNTPKANYLRTLDA
ncbi:hypothetical protein M2128_002186 [Polynucleobacter sphagniphilus]|uniref:hypothetical protein n=1 Tax=Polynucleobacter sphagniphilus TaxID=1743169 RepID=UPI002475C4F5|nr:hypothetical protein [Polynucleobacter sphagniphilus]MDH6303240.1 hypothetical protein [Polynucleobacter sphagniphilus]